MEVREAMTKKLVTIKPNTSIKEAAARMIKHRISSLIIVNSGYEIKGIVTEFDVVKAFATGKDPDIEVKNFMKKKVVVVSGASTLEEAASTMIKHKIKQLPVVERGKCVGIITASDLIRYEEHLMDRLAVLFLLPQKATQGG